DSATAFFAAYQEAIDNAVRHGNRYDIRKRIDVVFTIAKDKITAQIDDEGKGFNFNHYLFLAKEQDTVTRARASRAEGRIGGLGIKLMQQCCDHVEYIGKGTKLRIEKNIPAATTASGPAAAPAPVAAPATTPAAAKPAKK
ncbi:MAG: ATP-binding protein, partial [Planctomycetota bacterium]|nr:ATP-binding protein [Planctomycetota bacterium]